jgi:hypothetical protein
MVSSTVTLVWTSRAFTPLSPLLDLY